MDILRNSKVRTATVALILLSIALYVMSKMTAEYHYHDIVKEIRGIAKGQLLTAVAFCAMNYIVLTFYDALAFRYIRNSLEFPKIALTAFVSYTFSHNIGFALLSGGAVRYRLYSCWGLSAGDVARVMAFSGLHFWLGLFLLAGGAAIINHEAFAEFHHISGTGSILLGVLLVSPIVAYLGVILSGRKKFTWRKWDVEIPSLGLFCAAIIVATIDWMLAAAVLYALLPAFSPATLGSVPHTFTYFHLLPAFFAGQLAGVASHVPGGLGVFEGIMLYALSGHLQSTQVFGALILYRAIYYLFPFLMGVLALLAFEIRRKDRSRRLVVGTFKKFEGFISVVVPPVLAVAIFIGGTILLFSGVTPNDTTRFGWVYDLLPLPVIEASHFINSLVGVGLLILAWGVRKRLSSAYQATLILLAAGIVVSLGKGIDYEEASYLTLVLGAFWFTKQYFYRKSSLMVGLSTGPLLAIAAVLLCATWLGFFSYKHVEYSSTLWWEFAFDADAPRFLRAMIGAVLLLMFVCLQFVLRPRKAVFDFPNDEDLEIVSKILKDSNATSGNLAYLRDKHLLFNEDKTAFLMFRISGQTWIVLGDPIGNDEGKEQLVWSFRDLCDQHDGLCVFYEISTETIPHYLDVGLQLLKLGEEADVQLSDFSLEGRQGKMYRQILRKFEQAGFSFSIKDQGRVKSLIPRLKEISDEWLSKKNTKEKGFSLGFFEASYLERFPAAVVEKNGEVYAFANVWTTEQKGELSIDLMRHVVDGTNGLMDYLFISIMLWGKEQGYKTFNLGMAPLSGFEKHRLSPLWNKIGALLYKHGETFYNFDGLRTYKEKFRPEWEPRYLAYPSRLALPRILTNIATVVSGSVKGVFAK